MRPGQPFGQPALHRIQIYRCENGKADYSADRPDGRLQKNRCQPLRRTGGNAGRYSGNDLSLIHIYTIRSVGTSYGVPPETIASILLLQQHAGTEKNDAEFRKNATSELDYEMQKKLANDTEFNIHAIGAVLSVIADHFGVQQELREKDRKALNQILADFTMGKGLPDCYENGGDSKAKEFADQVNDCMEDVRVLLSLSLIHISSAVQVRICDKRADTPRPNRRAGSSGPGGNRAFKRPGYLERNAYLCTERTRTSGSEGGRPRRLCNGAGDC